MNIISFKDYAAMSAYGATVVIQSIEEQPDLLLCTATGSSPPGLCQQLREGSNDKLGATFQELRILKLYEWLGLAPTGVGSCKHYIQRHLIVPLAISEDRFTSFDSDTETPKEKCHRIRGELASNGPIDLCILGLGKMAMLNSS